MCIMSYLQKPSGLHLFASVGLLYISMAFILQIFPCSERNYCHTGIMHSSGHWWWFDPEISHHSTDEVFTCRASAFDSWGMLMRCEGERRWMRKGSRGWNSGEEGNSSWMHYLHVFLCVRARTHVAAVTLIWELTYWTQTFFTRTPTLFISW